MAELIDRLHRIQEMWRRQAREADLRHDALDAARAWGGVEALQQVLVAAGHARVRLLETLAAPLPVKG